MCEFLESLLALQLLLLRHAQGQHLLPLLHATFERTSAPAGPANGRFADPVQYLPLRVGDRSLLEYLQFGHQLASMGLLLLLRRLVPHEDLHINQRYS